MYHFKMDSVCVFFVSEILVCLLAILYCQQADRHVNL